MSRRKKDPLRPLTEPERQELAQLSRSQSAPAVEVTRAKILLAVARGVGGRRSGDAVAHLVARFNAEGTAAVAGRQGGGALGVEAGDQVGDSVAGAAAGGVGGRLVVLAAGDGQEDLGPEDLDGRGDARATDLGQL